MIQYRQQNVTWKSKDQKVDFDNKDLEVKQINHWNEILFMYKGSDAN